MKRTTINVGTGLDRTGASVMGLEWKLPIIRVELANKVGGYTESNVMGGWRDNEGNLIQETGKQWDVLGDVSDDTVRSLAQFIGQLLEQDTVLVSQAEVAATFQSVAYSREYENEQA